MTVFELLVTVFKVIILIFLAVAMIGMSASASADNTTGAKSTRLQPRSPATATRSKTTTAAATATQPNILQSTIYRDSLLALKSLGYTKQQSKTTIRNVILTHEPQTTEQAVKLALRELSTS